MAKRNIIVLGINDGHDAGAALIRNGQVVAAVQEERLNNIKHFTGAPEKSILEVFNIAKAHPSEVTLIALVSYDPPGTENLKSFKTKTLVKLAPLMHSDSYIRLYANYKKNHRSFKFLKKVFEKLGLARTETTLIEHQTAHASAAYRSSPWGYGGNGNNGSNSQGDRNIQEEVLILTADGSGDALSSTVNIGRGGSIERIAFSSYYDSLGNAFYTEITRLLGLKPWDHENKVMGLAPYGKPEYCIDKMRKVICIDKDKPLRFQNTIGGVGSNIQPKLKKLLANQRFDNIAAAAQQHLEDLMKKWVENAIRLTGINKVACAGGIFLNVKVNKLLRESKEVKDMFFYPAPDDEGSPVGAALQGYYEYCLREGIRPEHSPIADTYYGPSYDDEQIREILVKKSSNSKWKYDLCHDIDKTAGELIVKGKIIARCTGALEWGPRALGNRSIIADPQDMKVIHKINFAIKQRDFWMPFAPSILEERKDDYLIDGKFAPYMIMAFDSTIAKEGGDRIPATIHPYDRTCRPQTLRREWNPHYYKIIKTFEDSTGIGAILNTSFNLHGYPMVGTPEMALWTFENSELDALILGNYLVSKQ
jgi:carbamoyltransferase